MLILNSLKYIYFSPIGGKFILGNTIVLNNFNIELSKYCQRFSEGNIYYSYEFVKIMKNCVICTDNYLF